jgi:hypothetical protein
MEFYRRLGFIKFSRVEDFYPIDGKNHDAFLYLMYFNGGQEPPPDPPGMLEKVWDWISDLINKVADLTFGDGTESDSESDAPEDNLV